MRQKLQPKFTVEQALIILRNLKAYVYEAEARVMEPNKKFKDFTKLLNIIMSTFLRS
jgi:hypothetical protein